jgi:hypothetical protein
MIEHAKFLLNFCYCTIGIAMQVQSLTKTLNLHSYPTEFSNYTLGLVHVFHENHETYVL